MDLGYEHPGFVLLAEIMKVVGKLHLYLHNSADSFKSIAKKLDVVEDKLRFLFPGSLQRVKPHKEEAVAAWLRRLENATHDATRLLDDVESELKACGSPISMAWLSSDNRNMIRISYIIGKLASVCSEGETIIDENSLEDEKKGVVSLSRVAMTGQNKSLLDDDFLIGRDEEIALVRDMILKNDQYLTTATPLEVREEAEKLHIPQKGWITETLRKIDLSERAKQATEVYPYAENEMGNKVEYIHLHRSTDAHLRNPAVIPIVGISGVGKSALAKFIFNDGNVRKHFGDRSAWVYMTDKIDQLELVKKIICSFDSKYALNYTINLEGACIKLQNIIEGKRFLLVLDDVWDEIYVIWDDLRSVLIKGAPGSVVLVTTQLYSVANYVGTAGPVILDPLQSDDAWTLFKHYAFVDPSSNLSRGLETIGRNIINILPRLPLAVKVIGVTLRSKLEESNWEMLLKSWWWNISDDNFATRVISSLGSSYSTLPGYLRQCFVYCSIFPRNYVFKKDMLVQMWVANDFVQLNSSTGTTRLEDIAGEWFEELVDRAFFQTSVPETGYIMHDLVWDFASALSSNECHGISNKSNDVSHDVRYLSVDMEGLKALPDNFNIKQLRTILFIGDIDHLSSNETYLPLGRIFDGSISLRLLAFSCSLGAEIQNDMSALKHLRYLDLSFTGIRVVPDSVCSLCQLQVLDLRGCAFDKLPGNMNCLINLRHLHASSDTIAQIDGIGKLTKLQDLQEYRVQAEDGHRITELSNMNDLRGSLCISHLEMVTDPSDALEANIVKKNYVTALELRWSDTLPEELTPDMSKWILGCLSPPKYLQELKIYGYSGLAFPDCLGQLKHIRVIEISSCGNLQVLPPLGQLEHLQKLSLHQLDSIKVIGSEFYGNSNVVFRSLEELTFGSLLYWESWTYPGSIEFIPNLKRLRIYQCYELSSVPFESLGSATREMIFYFSCHHADTVSRYLQRLTCLTHLSINGGRPGSGKLILPCKQLGSLEYLHMELFNDVCIRGGLWYIRNLKHLWIIECRTRVTELDEEFAQEDGKQAPIQIDRVMHSLTHLSLGGGSTLIDLENVIPQTPSLRNLCLDRVMSFTSITEKWLQRLTSLQELELFRCTLLPSSLSSLSSLKRFSLKDCNRIYSIPPNSLPGNLKELQIEGCSLELEARCQNPNGEVWRPEGNTIELWRKRKIDEWQNRKLEYGQRKLIEMKQKKESLEIPISRKEKSPNSSKEDSLGQRMQGGHEWPRKQLMDEQSFIKREKPSSPSEQLEENKSEKEPLEEWLQQSEGDKWPPDGRREMNSWLMRKLKKSLDRNNDVPSNLMKERAEWLKEEEHKFRRETVGKDWPNISHVPYIRVNKQIVQNLYF